MIINYFANLLGQNLNSNINKIRQFLFKKLARSIGFEPAQLVFAMIFGVEERFSADLHRFFKVIGMLHIVSASGFNVSLVVKLFSSMLGEGIDHRLKAYLLTVVIVIYFLLSSRGVSLLRASLMAVLGLVLRLIFLRQSNPQDNLVVISFILLVLQSDYLTNISFQLSVLATGAILWVYPCFKPGSYSKSAQKTQVDLANLVKFSGRVTSVTVAIANYLKETFHISLAVNLVVLPLIIYHFQEVSLLSLPCNLLLLWLVPIITVAGLVWLGVDLVFCGLGLAGLTQISSLWVWLPTHLLLMTVKFLGDWDWAVIKMPKISFLLVFLWWFGLWLIIKIKKHKLRQSHPHI